MLIVPTDLSPVQIKVDNIPGIKTETDKIASIKAKTDLINTPFGIVKERGNIVNASLTTVLEYIGSGILYNIFVRVNNSKPVAVRITIDDYIDNWSFVTNDTSNNFILSTSYGDTRILTYEVAIPKFFNINFKTLLKIEASKAGVANGEWQCIYAKQ